MHDIFLSYSRRDTEIMQRVVKTLRDEGLKVWTDENLTPGTPSWKDAIQEAIENSKCLVALLSPDFKNSEWCERELDYARAMKPSRPIFPVLIRGDDSDAVPFELGNVQRANLQGDYLQGMAGLLEALTKSLNLPATPLMLNMRSKQQETQRRIQEEQRKREEAAYEQRIQEEVERRLRAKEIHNTDEIAKLGAFFGFDKKTLEKNRLGKLSSGQIWFTHIWPVLTKADAEVGCLRVIVLSLFLCGLGEVLYHLGGFGYNVLPIDATIENVLFLIIAAFTALYFVPVAKGLWDYRVYAYHKNEAFIRLDDRKAILYLASKIFPQDDVRYLELEMLERHGNALFVPQGVQRKLGILKAKKYQELVLQGRIHDRNDRHKSLSLESIVDLLPFDPKQKYIVHFVRRIDGKAYFLSLEPPTEKIYYPQENEEEDKRDDLLNFDDYFA